MEGKLYLEVGPAHLLLQPIEDPSIDKRELCAVRVNDPRWRKISKIAQQNPERVPNPAIGIAEAGKHFLREGHVIGVIDAADPQPNEIGAMTADEMTSVLRLDIGVRLRNLPAINIDHEAVRHTGLVWRAIVQRDARHER